MSEGGAMLRSIVVLKNNFVLVAAGFSLRLGKFFLYEKTFENRYKIGHLLLGLGLFCLLLLPTSPSPAAPLPLSPGQLLYVPVYSHIYFGDRPQAFNLSVTLSLRNVDQTHPIAITSVRYLDEKGKLVREYAPPALTLEPLASARFYIKESDSAAGSEACFLVQWQADQKVAPPIVDGLMVGASFGQGLSFTTSGRVLEELPGK
jgi:hypothetical protein